MREAWDQLAGLLEVWYGETQPYLAPASTSHSDSWLGSESGNLSTNIYWALCPQGLPPQRGTGLSSHSVDPESWRPGGWATGSCIHLSISSQ